MKYTCYVIQYYQTGLMHWFHALKNYIRNLFVDIFYLFPLQNVVTIIRNNQITRKNIITDGHHTYCVIYQVLLNRMSVSSWQLMSLNQLVLV